MNQKLEELLKKEREKTAALRAKFPLLFKGDGPRSGMSVGKGWNGLIENLCHILSDYLEHSVPEEIRGEMYVVQVKEKFGGLRFYMNQETPYITGAIALAESMSFQICEQCGAPGKPRTGGWVRTLCEKHAALEVKRRQKENAKCQAEQRQRAKAKEKAQESLTKQAEVAGVSPQGLVNQLLQK